MKLTVVITVITSAIGRHPPFPRWDHWPDQSRGVGRMSTPGRSGEWDPGGREDLLSLRKGDEWPGRT